MSADYFGEFSKQVAQRLAPGDASFVAMLTNGTSGDVNNIDFIHPRPGSQSYERIGQVAGKLATARSKRQTSSSMTTQRRLIWPKRN